ncbi:MAG TPA: hypothetical protein VGV59_14105 [Pyrinomonadaceae bacterium]|nr:hypothetical protein [Pyrinomonadaceae bacterium]
MEELIYLYTETPARVAIVKALDNAQANYQTAAELLRGLGDRAGAHRVLNLAQHASAQKCLFAQQWSLEDEAAKKTSAGDFTQP